jgi:hypothetical protein
MLPQLPAAPETGQAYAAALRPTGMLPRLPPRQRLVDAAAVGTVHRRAPAPPTVRELDRRHFGLRDDSSGERRSRRWGFHSAGLVEPEGRYQMLVFALRAQRSAPSA